MANTNAEVAREIAKRFMGGFSGDDILNRRFLCAEAVEAALSTAESNLAREVLKFLANDCYDYVAEVRDLFNRLNVKID